MHDPSASQSLPRLGLMGNLQPLTLPDTLWLSQGRRAAAPGGLDNQRQFPEDDLLGRIDAVDLKHVLGDIQTDRGNVHVVALQSGHWNSASKCPLCADFVAEVGDDGPCGKRWCRSRRI